MSADDKRNDHGEDELYRPDPFQKRPSEKAFGSTGNGASQAEARKDASARQEEAPAQADPDAKMAPEAATEQEESVPSAQDGVEELQQQAADAQEQVLRIQAEMQNVRRRAEIDVDKARKFAVERFVKELLPVADSLEKAVESAQSQAASDDVVASIREGAEMTLNLFLGSLEKFNVKAVNPVGEPFDPQLHEAMSMVPSPEAEPNSVVAVIQKGYTLNGRLVRPAMVMVAKPDDSAKIDEKA